MLNKLILNLLLAVILILGATSFSAWGDDTQDSVALREAAAVRYFKVVPTQEMFDNIISEVTKKMDIGLENKDSFEKVMHKAFDGNRVEQMLQAAMIKIYTVKEIDAMAAFYGTKEGKSVLTKSGLYMSEIMPEIQNILMEVFEEPMLMEKLETEHQSSTNKSE